MAGLASPERLLELLTASPQYAGAVADRLADAARELGPPGGDDGSAGPQVDLLWRIAGYLFRRRWETRTAAAVALERVGLAVAPQALARVLFGAEGVAAEAKGAKEDAGRPAAHGGLLSLGGLDLGRVLRDGEPLLASTGKEYCLEEARGSLSREELEAQKRAILRRLGLEVQDAEARRALEIGGGGLDGFGIQETDLTTTTKSTTGGDGSDAAAGQGARGMRGRARKRKLGEMALGDSKGGGAGGSTATRRRGARGASASSSSSAAAQDEGEKGPPSESGEQEPWLAEHLSVRLFDPGWESRHGAALGLTALFKAWRQRNPRGAGGDRWRRRWGEDVAGRCLCLLALDRFGDFSMGGAVAPIREVAGQLLGLVLAADPAGGGEEVEEGHPLLERAIGHLQTLAAAVFDGDGGEMEEEEVRPWEVRHGAFVGLKYLVALPSPPVRAAAPALLRLACGALGDANEDVREAAATTIDSLLRLLIVPVSGEGTQPPLDLPGILSPVFRALCSEGRAEGGEAVAAALFLPSFLRLGTTVLDRVLAATLPPNAILSLLPLSFWIAAPTPPVDELLGALWALGCCREPAVRGPALELLARVLRYWGIAAGEGGDDEEGGGSTTGARARRGKQGRKGAAGGNSANPRGRVQERAEALAWPVLKALRDGCPSPAPSTAPGKAPALELVPELQAVWTALVSALGPTRAAALAPRVAEDWLGPPSPSVALFPPGAAASDDWGARRRTAAALAQLAPEVVAQRAQAVLGSSAGGLAARECAILLLGQCLKAQAADAGGDGGAITALQAVLEEGLASHSETQQCRLAFAAAAALVEGGGVPENPGPLVRALMEAVKGEGDKERQGMAVEALAGLVAALLAAGRGRKAVEKVVGNLCVLACAMQQGDDAGPGAARIGAREALKGLVVRLGPQALETLPVLWPRILGGVQGTAPGASAEDAVRLLLVITPAVVDEGPALAGIRALAGGLVGLVTAAGGAEEEASTGTKLVSLLASRCLAVLLKRGAAGSLAARVGPLLHRALQDRGNEVARQRAAHCLLEFAKALRALPPSLEAEARAALPSLLPPALATVADDDPEVRGQGAEAFRLLVELAPLLQPQEWMRAHDCSALDPAEARARESVMLLVLGGGRGKGADGADADAAASSSLTRPTALPGLLRGGLVLRPYQWEGVRWLTLLRRAGLHGALCDEMGLGKTLQALVALAVARCEAAEDAGGGNNKDDDGLPSLVLCPASLSGHWVHEARRFLAPAAVEPLPYRAGLSRDAKAALVRGATGRHLVVASYDLLRRDAALLASRPWAHLLLDEAHVLRAGGGAGALGRAVRRLRAAHRVALTGTPLQNQVQDVWAVFDLLMPGLLGGRAAFEKEYGRPIGRATLRSAGADATAAALGRLERLHAHLLPFLLRREKARVLRDLPPKTVTDLACELVPLQREMYDGHCATAPAQAVLSGLAALVAAETGGAGGAGGGLAGGRDDVREQLGARALRLLHYLRLLCVHPALVLGEGSPARAHLLAEADCSGKMVALQQLLFACGVFEECREPAPEGEGEEDEEAGAVGGDEEEEQQEQQEEGDDGEGDGAAEAAGEGDDGANEAEAADAPSAVPSPPSSAAASSAEGQGLHRCLIFAQHRVTLDAIEQAILRRARWNAAYAQLAAAPGDTGGGKGGADADGPRYLRLDGSVPSRQREALVQRFNADASIALMLLTTRVGGLGLNLTGADVVIFVEHDWNPAVDLQAMDRAHRIGQGRPVNVYRLVTQGTVEEQVLALQRQKREMAAAVVQQGNAGRFEDRGMASVLDLVAASVGQGTAGASTSAAAASSVGAFGGDNGGGLLSLGTDGGGGGVGGGPLPLLPSEEPWDEGQYSGFAVEAFLSNVLGVGENGEGGGEA